MLHPVRVVPAGLLVNNVGTINNSISSGDVGGGTVVGGFVSQNNATINNSSSFGSVTGTSSQVGGFVGRNISTGTISNGDSSADSISGR